MMRVTNMQQDSSMLNWFSKIKDILPVPRTVILEITTDEAWQIVALLDGKEIPDAFFERIKENAAKIGYPLFMRSDQSSAKHDYENSCHIASEKDLLGHLACLFEWHLMRDLWPQAIVFRELLPLYAPFKAFDGLPIAKERRYFVDEGKVMCHHPYWPEGAIQTGRATKKLIPGWEKKLAMINQEDYLEVACLTRMAEDFNECVPGFYSVDFALTTVGKWYMIDAARGELSYHPEHEDA